MERGGGEMRCEEKGGNQMKGVLNEKKIKRTAFCETEVRTKKTGKHCPMMCDTAFAQTSVRYIYFKLSNFFPNF